MRLAATIACLALACLGTVTAAPAKTNRTHPPQLVRAGVTACPSGAVPTDRNATFVGSMSAVKGATRMEMRFDLLQQRPGEVYTRVPVPKWGIWAKSLPGVPSFSYERRVEQLSAPAAYRVLIRFRWRDGAGHVVRHARRYSAVCVQPDPRPDLVLGKLTTAPTTSADTKRSDIVVRNTGRTDVAVPFQVVLDDESGARLGDGSLLSLPAGQQATVSITAPACYPGQRLRFTADAGGAVDEAIERNNTASRTCPGAP